jgi:type I restriction enzyme S subunit
MRSEWKEMSLREAGVSLIDCVHKTPPAAESGYPYVAIPQLKNGRIDLSGVRRITKENFLEWTKKADPQPYDVVLSRRCNPGETAFVPAGFKGALGQNLVLLRSDGQTVFPPFLRWLVRSPQWWEQVGTFLNVGAVFDSLKCADIPNFRLPIPPIAEQKAIAHILGTLDDKIELNQQMNRTLEGIARALFKSWFIDFDPVRAKLDGRQPDRMDAETAALFPDAFEDGGAIGPIPKGWRVGQVQDIGEVICGKTPSTREPENYGSEVPFITIPDMHGKIFALRTSKYLSAKGVESQSKKTLPPLSICVSCIATPGLVVMTTQPSQTNQQINSVVPSSGDSSFYYFFALRDVAEEIKARGSGGSVFANLNKSHFSELPVLLAPQCLQVDFHKKVEPLLEKLLANENESFSLASTRDALLPKLLSGEIRVKAAEQAVEAMA